MNARIIEAVAVAAELCGTQLSPPAARAFAEQLAAYEEGAVVAALQRCMRELKGRLTLAEVLSRIDDGRPGPDEAWAMLPWDEESTAVLTSEMQEAQGAAWAAYQNGDKAGARYAFREAYIERVTAARAAHQPVEWQVSLGWDKAGREGPIKDAIARGRLSPSVARRLLPDLPEEDRLRITGNGTGLKSLREIAGELDFMTARRAEGEEEGE